MKKYTQIKSVVLIAIIAVICNLTNNPLLKAAEPEWMHVMSGYIVSAYVEDGEYMWLSEDGGIIYKYHKQTNKIADSIMYEGDFIDLDSYGNLWMANQTGFARYSNNKLTIFDDSSYSDFHVNDMFITSMNIDKNNNIWFGTEISGIFKFDGTKFTNYDSYNTELPKHTSSPNVYIHKIEFDANNNGWFIINNGEIAKFDGSNWTLYNDTNSALPTNLMNDIKADKSGNVWISNKMGLTKFDGQNWTTFKNENSELQIQTYGSMAFDKLDNIWFIIGYDKGVAKFDGDKFEVLNIENSELLGTAVMSVFVDSYNNKWFSVINGDTGYRGVDIYNENGIILTSVNENNENISGISVYPNPASDFITIQPSEGLKPSEGYKVQLFDVLGIEVISTPSLRDTPQEGNFRIDVSGLQSGVYFIRIGDRVEKFVKM